MDSRYSAKLLMLFQKPHWMNEAYPCFVPLSLREFRDLLFRGTLSGESVDQIPDVLGTPSRASWREFNGLWIPARLDSFPPAGPAYGDYAQHLRQS